MSQPQVPQKIVFLEFPIFVLTWPLIVVGWILWILAPAIGDQMCGIIWITTLFIVLLAMGFDFDRFETAIIFLVTALIVVTMMLITSQWKIPIFHQIMEFIGVLKLNIHRDVMLALSCLLSIAYLLMIINAYLNHRWVVSPGKMERYEFWRKAEELSINQTLNVNLEFHDQLDRLLLFNGGHLRVKLTPTTSREIGLVWGDIEKLDAAIDVYEILVTSQ